MGDLLNNLMVKQMPAYQNTDAYMTFMLSHMKFIREHSTTQPVILDQGQVYKNDGDFYGLFTDMGYVQENFNLYLWVNQFDSPTQLSSDVVSLLIPSDSLINQLKLLFRTQQGTV